MVRIRLARTGAKKKPSYRVAVADKRSPRNGRCIEYIGHYNPMVEPPVINIDLARADYWLQKGAQPSETVASLLKKARAASGSAE
ncbi:MAG: 30S ribosomal protein S16 [Deltaproteobacteria bacterium]|nr:30S ribosomal protein S16 [Deltaproteobacteria bacterium]